MRSPPAEEDDWAGTSPEERIEAVWTLTRECLSWQGHGAPLQGLGESDLASPGLIFQIGVAPVRIDVLTAIDAVEFDEAWEARLRARLADLDVPVLSREHLVRNKRAAGRLQDLADVEWLERNAPGRTP